MTRTLTILAALLFGLPALAVDIAPTACGAGGTGLIAAGPNRGTVETREPVPGQRVNDAGEWAHCTMPPRPRDCPALRPKTTDEKGRPVMTYLGIGAEYIGKYRTQLIRVHRSASDRTIVELTSRRMYCTAGGWSVRP